MIKKNLQEDLKRQKTELDRARESEIKAITDLKKMQSDYAKLSREYKEALKENRMLDQKVSHIPAKVTELAQQNRTLIKETADMHYNLGVFYMKNKEYQRAVMEFEKAIYLRPDDAHAHFNLGFIYSEHLLDRPKAIEHFQWFLKYATKDDKDTDFARNYLLTWQSYQGKEPTK